MNTTYALVVGIDAYQAVPPLEGCRNDAAAVVAMLRGRTGAGTRLSCLPLYDKDATRDAIIAGFRSHLGQAGPGDTALFWFAGHGSHAPVPRALWHLEPTGETQTLVCADSRIDGVPDLYDKELSLLLGEVAANGCQVAVVLDSCHSGGADRGGPVGPVRVRGVPPAAALPASGIPPLTATPPAGGHTAAASGGPLGGRPVDGYVALAACRSFELAHEMPIDGVPHGLFSWALLRALGRLGPSATYRELLVAARCAVEDFAWYQVPQVFPIGDGPADRPFLGGGRATRPGAGMVMRYVHGGWEVDAGSCHGLPPAADGMPRVAVQDHRAAGPDSEPGGKPDSEPGGAGGGRRTDPVPAREAVLTAVLTERSTVEPTGWTPDPSRQYPVVLTGVPLPPTAVMIDDPGGGDGTLPAALATAVATAGPHGGPSPHLRLIRPGPDARVPELRVRVTEAGRLRVLGADGARLAGDITASDAPSAARAAVAAMEHIARWRQVKSLVNPASWLAGQMGVEIVDSRPGERTAPLDRPALQPDGDGLIRLRYRPSGTGWTAPTVFIRLRNRSRQRLYCALLDLTDRYRIHCGLFPGDFVGAGLAGAALGGRPVEVSLPAGVPVRPGASSRDWFVLLVAEEEFSARPFELPRLGEPTMPLSRLGRGFGGVLERLGRTAVYRDAGPTAADAAYDWTTVTVPVRTEVPDATTGGES